MSPTSPASQRAQAAKVAERIRLSRSLVGLSQEDVARQLGVTVRTYARWERCETLGFLGELEPIAKVLQTTPEDLLGPSDEDPRGAEVAALRAELAEVRGMVERILVAVEKPAARRKG